MSFDLEEHERFIKDVKENPDSYKPVGEQIYCSPNGMSLWRIINKVCPICGSENGFYKVIGNQPSKGWNECLDCGWKGGQFDTFTEEEYTKSLNEKRFEKLNDIL